MPQKRAAARSGKSGAAGTKRAEIAGHTVEVLAGADGEELWVDGVRRRFFTTSDGYVLLDDAYVPAEATLLDAAVNHVRRRLVRPPTK